MVSRTAPGSVPDRPRAVSTSLVAVSWFSASARSRRRRSEVPLGSVSARPGPRSSGVSTRLLDHRLGGPGQSAPLTKPGQCVGGPLTWLNLPMLALPDLWIWDSWAIRDGATYHLFFLQAPSSLGDPS